MAMTESFLAGKNNEELRNICNDRGITGMSKQTKATLVSVILNDLQIKKEIPTRDELEGKSVPELRQMCESRGMTGLDNQPKPTLIDLLLNDCVEEALTGVQGQLTVERDEEGELTTSIKISCGGSEDEFPVVGRTIGDVMGFLQEALNIPEDPMVIINGNETEDMSYVLQSSDELDFVQKADDKGNN